jgi:hypothetical protein
MTTYGCIPVPRSQPFFVVSTEELRYVRRVCTVLAVYPFTGRQCKGYQSSADAVALIFMSSGFPETSGALFTQLE